MSDRSRFLNNIDRGRIGLNQGLPNGLDTFNRYIYGIQKKRYYLIGGSSGTGKTTLSDFMFVFSPYRVMKQGNAKVHWKYYSFEQSKEAKENSWASKIMFDIANKRLPVAYIMGKGKNRINDEDYQLCMKIDGFLEEMFDHIEMIGAAITPTQFRNDMLRYGKQHGTWLTEPLLDENGNPRKGKNDKPMMQIIGWKPNNPDEYHIVMMDHIAYAAIEDNNTLKQNIDKISRMIVQFRELTNWTFAVIQQFNTELASIERQKFKKNAIAPQMVDFGDSRYTFQDADVVMGMLNPYNYDIMDYGGYDVKTLKGYAIWAFLMKNRHDGPINRSIPLFMDPVTGMFYELPIPLSKDLLEMSGGDDPVDHYYKMASEFNESIKLYE